MNSETAFRETIETIRKDLGNASLMAVSKTRTVEEIDCVYKAGIRLFGENHVQEIVSKFTTYRPEGLELHMIGHLQSNKVSKVVPLVDMIESVDSLRLLAEIDKAAGRCRKRMQVLLEYNTSGEQSKSGFGTEEELFECIKAGTEMENIVLRGLMTVGPLEHPENTQQAFAFLRHLREKCLKLYKDRLKGFDVLSMGMSHDWKLAVAEGSTEVRIGTAIFGPRNQER